MSKMTVIQLLNKIANGEEVPKVIKVHNRQYKWKDELNIYACGKSGALCFDFFVENNKLNDEVEIIDEDKKLEKMIKLNNISNSSDMIALRVMQWENNKIIEKKINEIIDYINKGDKE